MESWCSWASMFLHSGILAKEIEEIEENIVSSLTKKYAEEMGIPRLEFKLLGYI